MGSAWRAGIGTAHDVHAREARPLSQEERALLDEAIAMDA